MIITIFPIQEQKHSCHVHSDSEWTIQISMWHVHSDSEWTI
jgi:hypothetical protein